MADYTSKLELYRPNRRDNLPVDETLAENFSKIDEAFSNISPLETSETVTVGSSGNYSSITEALEAITKRERIYKKNGVRVELKLLSGFRMNEQISLDGIDLSWITLTSQDDVVTLDRKGVTETLIETRKPAFFAKNGATLPVIGVQFSMTPFESGDPTKVDGITVAFGSSVILLPESGIDNATRGLGAYYGSRAICYMEGLTEGGGGTGAGATKGVSFKNASNRAFMASYSSHISCARSQLQDCEGDYGVYVIWNSTADIYQSDVSGASGTAVCSRDGSTVNARETNVSGAVRGFHALHGSLINARYYANEWSGDGAMNCSGYGVLASANSRIEAPLLPVGGSNRGVHASSGSSVNFLDGNADGCNLDGVSALGASQIDARNASANDCGGAGFSASEGSSVGATGSTANNCGTGFNASRASSLSAHDTVANDCGVGYNAEHGSVISADFGEALRAGSYGFSASETSRIQARGAKANNASDTGFYALRASEINCREGQATSCGNHGVYAVEGSNANCVAGSYSGGTNGLRVLRGSTITANNASGSLSQSAREVTANGIIFQ